MPARKESVLPRILLVEDEQIIRDVLVPILFAAGFECREAADGRSAINLLGGTRIDLVLSNLLLPEVDGWTLFLHVRQRYSRVPFVFMTAVRDPDVRQAAMKQGPLRFS
jgi:CheY-like chemotaxis protein